MSNLAQDATHKSECGKYLYKVIIHTSKCPFDGSTINNKKVGFWDAYCNKWRGSIMYEHQLVKIK